MMLKTHSNHTNHSKHTYSLLENQGIRKNIERKSVFTVVGVVFKGEISPL